MYPTSIESEARQERYKDMLRHSDRARLIRESGLQLPGLWATVGKFARRIGMMRPVWRRSRPTAGPVVAACSGQHCC